VAGSTQAGAVLGILYALVFLAVVLAAPILLIASGLLFLLNRYGSPKAKAFESDSSIDRGHTSEEGLN
jgi:hypothetical protein